MKEATVGRMATEALSANLQAQEAGPILSRGVLEGKNQKAKGGGDALQVRL